MGGKDQAGAHRPAFDAVPADQLEHQIRPGANCIDDMLAAFQPVVAQDRIVPRLQIRHHLSECASRCTPADVLRLQHGDVDAGFRQMQRRGKPGEARADYRDRDMPWTFEPLCGGRWRRIADIDVGRARRIGQRLIHARNDAAGCRDAQQPARVAATPSERLVPWHPTQNVCSM
jgi:hypothetical protein